jgi:alpha-tubulin suppressor-like RCC1 family protein
MKRASPFQRANSLSVCVLALAMLFGHKQFARAAYISTQPHDTNVLAGANATFTVVAGGTAPLRYRWRFNETNLANGGRISGATNSMLTISNVVAGDAGGYRVVVSNSASVVTSAVATLTMLLPPTITTHPTNQLVPVYSEVTIYAAASGTGPLFYQWQKDGLSLTNGGRISGATNAALTVSGIQTNDAGDYRLTATNLYGAATSAVATLTVLLPPVIADPPVSHSTVTNGDTFFQVSATGDGPLFYQWQREGTNLVEGPRLIGSGSNILNILDVQSGDLGAYRVVVSNAVGVAVSAPASLAFGGVLAWGDGAGTVPPDATNMVAISAGLSHSLGLRADGTVVAWGWNFWGQNDIPASATNVVGIAAGGYHSLALRADGTVVGWGNYDTQAIVPANATNVAAICAGDFFSLALRKDDSVVGWGWGANGELNIPASATNIVALTCGGFHALALRADGTVVAWGSGFWGQTGVPAGLNHVVAIAAGELHSLALRADGTVVGWGDNRAGQVTIPDGLSNVVAIAAGYSHSLALRADGSVIAWGGDGTGPTAVPTIATNVTAIAAGGSQSLALLASMPLYLGQAPNLLPQILQPPRSQTLCDGDPGVLQAGMAGALPEGFQWLLNSTPLAGATNRWLPIPTFTIAQAGDYQLVVTNPVGAVTSIVATLSDCGIRLTEKPANRQLALWQVTDFHVGAIGTGPISYQWQKNGMDLTPDGHVQGLGTDTLRISGIRGSDAGVYGCLMGNPYGSSTNVLAALSVVPVRVWGWNGIGEFDIPDAASNVIALATGYDHHLGLRPDGTVLGWGYNYFGQATPPVNATGIVAIAAGMYHSLALRTNGSLLAWGDNRYQQATVPGDATNIVRIAASYHSLVLRADGAVRAWGLNNAGQTTVPPEATNIVAIAAGDFHSLALRADGVVVGWGDNTYGQITTPPGLSGVIALAAGRYHSLALRADGTVAAWGDDQDGQCSGLASAAGVVEIDAGNYQSIVLYSNRSVQACGANNPYGQVNVPSDLTNVVWAGMADETAIALLHDPERPLPPALLMSPRDRAVPPGAPVNLYAAAAGPLPLRWQWFYQGALLPGQTNSWLSFPQFQSSDNGAYGVVAANDFGSVTSAVANVMVAFPPEIVAQPGGQVLLTGTNLILSVTATGTIPLGFQWQKDGTNLANSGRVTGADADHLTITGLLTNDSGGYRVVVGNVMGVVTSLVANVSVFAPPFIITPPANATVGASSNASFSVVAGGTAPLGYQWQFSAADLPGKTNPVLSLTNVQAPNAGDYTVVVTNAYGAITSAVAALTVLPVAPIITTQSVSRVASVGQNVSFNVVAKGSEPMTCQWQFNGAELPGANAFTLALSNVNWSRTGTYRAAVSNAVTVAFTTNITLTVSPVLMWGLTNLGQVAPGAGITIPAAATNVMAIAAGGDGTLGLPCLALRADGTLVRWGVSARDLAVPGNAVDVVAMAIGGESKSGNYLALRTNGTLVHWNNFVTSSIPAAVTNGRLVAVAAGAAHQLALRDDGTVFAWGNNTSGQTNVPPAATNVIAIAAGLFHSLALRADGTVVGWGLNTSGQAAALSNFVNVVAIAAGGNQSLGLLADGTVVGRIVTNMPGTSVNYGPPTGDISNKIAIAAGTYHSLALGTSRTVNGWGATNSGQITIPAYATNVLAIAAGGNDSLALVADPFAPPIPPRIGRPPLGRALIAGDNVVFNALAVGGLPLRYQWYVNGSPVAGQTNQSLTLTNAHPREAGDYQLVAVNAFGSATSAVATVTVSLPAPVLMAPGMATNGFRFNFNSIADIIYVVEYRDSLNAGGWAELERRLGAGVWETVTDASAQGAARFYRVRALYAPPPELGAAGYNDGAVNFSFATVDGAQYVVEVTDQLAPPQWQELQVFSGTGGSLTFTNSTLAAPQKFFRLRVR